MRNNLLNKIQIVLLFVAIIPVLSSNSRDDVKALWSDLINATKLWSEVFSSDYRLNFNRLAKNTNISIECRISVEQTLKSIEGLDLWGHQMLNSWGRFPPSGLLEGTSSDFGSYDLCLSIKPNQVIGEPQYCMIDLSLPLPQPQPRHHNLYHSVDVLPPEMKNKSVRNSSLFANFAKEGSIFYWIAIRTGICVPNKCSLNDIRLLTNKFANNYGLERKSIRCEVNEEKSLNSIQMIAIFVIMMFVCTGIIATITEYFISSKNNSHFVQIFSINENIKKLFSPQSTENLSCLHGLRVINIVWVILGHTTVWVHYQMFSRSFAIKDILTSTINNLLLNVEYGVDTIFFISGLITTYIALSVTNSKREKFSSIGFLLARIIRLSPQLVIFLLINFLWPLVGSGPVWREQSDVLMDRCYKNWWLNVLYLQNFIDVQNMCAHHTWYLASDMQFHFISLIIIFVFFYNYKMGFILNIITVFIFFIITSGVVFVMDMAPSVVNTARDKYFQDAYVDYLYYKPWPHGINFFVGLAFGFVVYRKKLFVLKNRYFYMVWITMLLGFWIPMLDDIPWNDGTVAYDRYFAAFWFPFTRLVWAICVSLLIWCCLSGNGGIINKFLSWKAFVPLARLTYSVYLTHAWVVWIFYGTRRERIDLSTYSLILIFSHNVLMSYIIGAIFAIIFEMPVLKINKYLMTYFNISHQNESNNKDKSLFTKINSSNENNNEKYQDCIEEQTIHL